MKCLEELNFLNELEACEESWEDHEVSILIDYYRGIIFTLITVEPHYFDLPREAKNVRNSGVQNNQVQNSEVGLSILLVEYKH